MSIVYKIQLQDYRDRLVYKVHYGKQPDSQTALCGFSASERLAFVAVPLSDTVLCKSCIKSRVRQGYEVA